MIDDVLSNKCNIIIITIVTELLIRGRKLIDLVFIMQSHFVVLKKY